MKLYSLWTAILLLLLFSCFGNATEEMAEKTGKSCAFCHLDPSGGGELTEAGKDYLKKSAIEGKEAQEEVDQSERKKASDIIRLFIGYLHILTAIFWFGTILYVHIILKPSYAAHGLPKREVRLGLISIIIMAVTGVILSVYRITSPSILFNTRFGILLIIKVSLFLIMAVTAFYVVLFIGPKLKKKKAAEALEPKGDLTIDDLILFNGTEDQAVFFAYKGKIYDVSKSEHWKKGIHFSKHRAGSDLTEMLSQAPHGEEKIIEMSQMGKLIPTQTEKKRPRHERIFYFMAYMNLILVFLITLILALWRWW
ncbi:MAG: CopD family protein [Candidatus Aminicenantes bacterium]|nr:MAG: CopD family protein [Candidatus Aminicenantes bacterium]